MGDCEIKQISPGLCPPEGCPPPTRIECIVIDKVYDSCFQLEERVRDFVVPVNKGTPFPAVGDILQCSLDPLSAGITCSVVPGSRQEVPDQPGFFTMTLLIQIPLSLTIPDSPFPPIVVSVPLLKTVTLCCPEGTFTDCSESALIFCNCVVTAVGEFDFTVTCTVQVCLVIKCLANVQLLVPSYGFCVPAPCITLPGICPPSPPVQCF